MDINFDSSNQNFRISDGKIQRVIPSVQGSPTLSLQNYIEYTERKIAWETAGRDLAKSLMLKGKKV